MYLCTLTKCADCFDLVWLSWFVLMCATKTCLWRASAVKTVPVSEYWNSLITSLTYHYFIKSFFYFFASMTRCWFNFTTFAAPFVYSRVPNPPTHPPIINSFHIFETPSLIPSPPIINFVISRSLIQNFDNISIKTYANFYEN